MPVDRPIQMDRLLMLDIGDPHGVGPVQDLFGVEVELEGRNLKTTKASIMQYWTIHNDGSLRVQKPGDDACEYVFKRPLDIHDTGKALANLFEHLSRNPDTKVYDSYRTSIHVHVNCLSETMRTIVNFLTLSIIFDELFVSQNGDTRIGNNFCLRSKDAEGQIADLIQTVTKYGSLFNLSSNDRYSATNFVSLLKFGTVEFRSLECTTDLHRVMHWVNTLQALKVAARQYENPREIISKFSRRGPLGFMISHLGEWYGKYAMVPGAHQMLHNGMRLAQDFAFCSEWRQATEAELKGSKPKKGEKMIGGLPIPADMVFHMNQMAQLDQLVNQVPPPQGPPPNDWWVPGGGAALQNMAWAQLAPAQPAPPVGAMEGPMHVDIEVDDWGDDIIHDDDIDDDDHDDEDDDLE